MLQFRACHRSPILRGAKTQTRRIWDAWRVNVGSLHWATTDRYRPESRFARLCILERWEEKLGDITVTDANAEGYTSQAGYHKALLDIYPEAPLNTVVKCVRFVRVPDKTKEVRLTVVNGELRGSDE